jgi:hypothetical protein
MIGSLSSQLLLVMRLAATSRQALVSAGTSGGPAIITEYQGSPQPAQTAVSAVGGRGEF